jgi:hypothetical protein
LGRLRFRTQRRAAGWPTSDRNPGRLRIGTGGRLQIGMQGRLRRNPHTTRFQNDLAIPHRQHSPLSPWDLDRLRFRRGMASFRPGQPSAFRRMSKMSLLACNSNRGVAASLVERCLNARQYKFSMHKPIRNTNLFGGSRRKIAKKIANHRPSPDTR